VAFHRDRNAEATVALTPVDDPSAFGVVPTDAAGRVTAFIEKPLPGHAPTNLINAGTYVLEPSVLARIPDGRRVSIERETFPGLVRDGRLFALGSPARWVDAGTPATYLAANLHYAAARPSGNGIAATASVTNSVLGGGVTVAAGAGVDSSVCFDGVAIEAGAEVRSSIIGRGTRVGAGAIVTDLSVVGDNLEVPPGARLTGDRLPAPVP
jgi:mannose-1-phosphate guanylyltransferase